jgi:hypothetical protein
MERGSTPSIDKEPLLYDIAQTGLEDFPAFCLVAPRTWIWPLSTATIAAIIIIIIIYLVLANFLIGTEVYFDFIT